MINSSLQLQFAKTKRLDPRITFTRASTATYYDQNGRLAYADSGEPRFTHDPATGDSEGLLVEESRTNLLTYSEDFDNAAWVKSNVTISANATTAPDGTLTADLYTVTTSSLGYVYQTATVTASTTYTFSFYYRAVSGTLPVVAFYDNTNNAWITTAATKVVSDLKDGWVRVHSVVTTPVGCTSIRAYPDRIADGTLYSLYLWGVQLEQGAFPTSYQPSTQTFTSRASTATYYDSTGTLQSAAIDTARMNYNPADLTAPPKLLLEGASTNLLTYSEDFDNAAWTKNNSTISANATTAPDGTVTADKVIVSATTANHYISYNNLTVAADTICTISVYVKQAEQSKLVIQAATTGGWLLTINTVFDLAAGTVYSGTGRITDVGGGWFRCSVAPTTDATGGLRSFLFGVANSTGALNYTGDGTSGIYLWGAQLEEGAFPTSYIPTTTAAVTRAADVSSSAATTRAAETAVIDGQAFTDFYNQEEGTLLGEVNCLYDYIGSNTFPGVCRFSDGTTTNVIFVAQRVLSAVTDIGATIYKNGVLQNSDLSTLVEDNPTKFCMAYSENYLAIASTNDASLNKDTTDVNIPSVDRFEIGKAGNAGNAKRLTIKSLTYWPKKLSDAVLQALTS